MREKLCSHMHLHLTKINLHCINKCLRYCLMTVIRYFRHVHFPIYNHCPRSCYLWSVLSIVWSVLVSIPVEKEIVGIFKVFLLFLYFYFFPYFSAEKIRPEKELDRAKSEILRCKFKIRELFRHLDSLSSEGRFEESLFDSKGQIDSEDVSKTSYSNTQI